jgi:hypothetical protein
MADPFLSAKLEEDLASGNGSLMRLQRPVINGAQPRLSSGSDALQMPAPTLAVATSKKTGKRK